MSRPNERYYRDVYEPDHYTSGDIETIDYIRDKLTPSQFLGYCIGNALKYVSRFDKKGEPVKDLDKAMVYLGWAIDTVKDEEPEKTKVTVKNEAEVTEQVLKTWRNGLNAVAIDSRKDIEVALAKSIVGGPDGFSADDWYHEEFGDDNQDKV